MRTTIEITEEQRAELLKLAAIRGHKGFSQLVQEALNEYLSKINQRGTLISNALKMQGILSDKEAHAIENTTRQIRDEWR
jgi:metal-responsive CopG/Arc/MetJ family transcriptional regulator